MLNKKIPTIVILVLAITSNLAGADIRYPWSVQGLGGAWFGPNGDVRTFLVAYDRYAQRFADAYGATKSGSMTWPSTGVAFGGELTRRISSRLRAGLAVEWLSKSASVSKRVSFSASADDVLEAKLKDALFNLRDLIMITHSEGCAWD